MPEISAQRKAILAGGKIDFFLSLHNTETNEWMDGPAGPFLGRFFSGLEKTATFSASRPPQPLPTKEDPGRYNVSEYLSAKHGIPAFLMEQRISAHPKLGRRPGPDDRMQFGRELFLAAWIALTVR